MVSLNSQPFLALNQQQTSNVEKTKNSLDVSLHQQWDSGSGWKNTLNNLRLILQPTLALWLIFPWIEVFPNSKLNWHGRTSQTLGTNIILLSKILSLHN